MARDIEFYSSVEELEPVFQQLFSRDSTAFALVASVAPELSTASTFKEISSLIDMGVSNFRIAIPGISVSPPMVDSVVNQASGALRYFFVDNIGGPFLDFDVPVMRANTVKPGAFSRKRQYFSDRSYEKSLPDSEVKEELSAAIRYVKKTFLKYVINSKRAWYFSPAILNGLKEGTINLAGPLEGHELAVMSQTST